MVSNLIIGVLAFLLVSGWAPLTFVEASGHGSQGAEREASSGDLEEYSVRSRASLKSQARREKKRISFKLLPRLSDRSDGLTMATGPREALFLKRTHQPFHKLHTVFRI